MNQLLEGLKKIKNSGGQWYDFIENENGLIEENYELAMNALKWNPEIHSEKQFDDKIEEIFNTI